MFMTKKALKYCWFGAPLISVALQVTVQEWWQDAYHHWTIGRLGSPCIDKASNKWLELAWSLCDHTITMWPHKNTLLWLLLSLHAIFLSKRPSAMRLAEARSEAGGKVVVVVLLPFTISWRWHKDMDWSINLTNNGRISLFLVWNSLLWGFKYGAGGSGGHQLSGCSVTWESLVSVCNAFLSYTNNQPLFGGDSGVSSSILYSLSLEGAALEEEESELLMVEPQYLLCCTHHAMLHTML
jgi:hypothetical protein